jgi:tetratricopeptide (TPR) repeat protein
MARIYSWTKPAIRIAAAGLGVAVAGPLGGGLGGWLGEALGQSAADLVENYLEKFGDKASEKLLETIGDSLTEKLKEPSPPLEKIYREALRLSLAGIYAQIRWYGFDDWFENWESCLAGTTPLDLSAITPDQLIPQKLDSIFQITMERLDAQGRAMRQKSLALTARPRALPAALLSELAGRLPELLQEKFRTLIVKPENDQAWKQTQLIFQDFTSVTLGRIDENVRPISQITDDTAVIRRMVEFQLDRAIEEGRIVRNQEQAARAQIETLTAELQKLKEQVSERKTEPGETALANLLATGDLDGAVRVKAEQIDARRGEVDKLARDLFELGSIHQLRFSRAKALSACREAWHLKRDPTYGFKYAYLAQQQNQFQEAVGAYEAVLMLYRDLAQANPEAYLPDVAMTLNNLAILYRATQRMKEAEEAYQEALALRRDLAQANPEAYLPNVAMTLNNLAILYSDTQRMKEAEGAYQEALSTYRDLAQANPEAYLPDVAMTLNNLAVLYSATQRMKEAEDRCCEAERCLEPLWHANPPVHGDQMARILGVHALLCEPDGGPGKDGCAFAQRGFAIAYDPAIKEAMQTLIDRLCVDTSEDKAAAEYV